MRRMILFTGVMLAATVVLQAQPPPEPRELGIKYVRDSLEYATLARQVYRMAAATVREAHAQGLQSPWAVVLDIDETALDNSTYQLERAAYRLPYDSGSWDAWVKRREAGVVPGVASFIATVRELGGHVAWISNRDTVTRDATRANLERAGIWSDGDRLCTQDDRDHTKRARRTEVVRGAGACAWADVPMHIVAFVGDQMGDFPEPSENIAGTGEDQAFGQICFLIPNPMYGEWTRRVTRTP